MTSDARVLILKLGPFIDEEDEVFGLYVPVLDGRSEPGVRAATDREGIHLVAAAYPENRIVCQPLLAEAAEHLGYAVNPLDAEEYRLRAELLIAVAGPENLRSIEPGIGRELLLEGLAAFLSVLEHRIDDRAGSADVRLEGTFAPEAVSVEIALSWDLGNGADRPEIRGTIYGETTERVEIALRDDPEMLRSALEVGFQLRRVPSIMTADEEATFRSSQPSQAALGHALATTATAIISGRDETGEIEYSNGIHLRAVVSNVRSREH